MAGKSGGSTVPSENVVLAQAYELEALLNVLERKGLATKAEVWDQLKLGTSRRADELTSTCDEGRGVGPTEATAGGEGQGAVRSGPFGLQSGAAAMGTCQPGAAVGVPAGVRRSGGGGK
jgi:hypothetical protein